MGTPCHNHGARVRETYEEEKRRKAAPDSPALITPYHEPNYRWAEVMYIMSFVWPTMPRPSYDVEE